MDNFLYGDGHWIPAVTGRILQGCAMKIGREKNRVERVGWGNVGRVGGFWFPQSDI